MTSKKSTKRAFMLSLLSLLMCCTMLLGTTFAWFTDTVTSTGNRIVAGTLDVQLWMYDADDNKYVDISNGTGDIFDEAGNGANWEPGKTEIVYLAVANVGSLDLAYEILVDVDGRLANALEYAIYDNTKNDADLAKAKGNWTALKAGADATADLEEGRMVVYPDGTLLDKTENYFALAIHMKEDAGNEYQAEEVVIDVRVSATQMASETDSFGATFDADAWDGEIATAYAKKDDAAKVIEIANGPQLALLADEVNKGNNYKGWTVKLIDDIDLGNFNWTPIGNTFATAFYAKMDGGNHTIYNLNVSGTAYAGLIGCSRAAAVENVKVENAIVKGFYKAGVIAAEAYGGSPINNCHVTNAVVESRPEWLENKDVYDNGNHVGGILGYMGETVKMDGNSVTNAEIRGYRDIGGLVGTARANATLTNNTLKDIVLSFVDKAPYADNKAHQNAGTFVGRNVPTVIDATNVATNVIVPVIATTQEEVADALKKSDVNVLLAAGKYTFPTKFGSNVTLTCEEGTVFEGNSKLNANGATVVGATFSNPSGTAVDQTINGTFKDCVFTGSNALRWCYAGENVVFENCVFSGSVYGVHFDGGANEATFRNCTFSGFNAFGGAITMLNLENCTFVANGRSGYNGVNLWGSVNATGCKFIFDGSTTEWVDMCGDNKTATFTNCVISDGTTERALDASDVGDYGSGNTITVQ